MKNPFEDPKIIDFAARKFETDDARNEALIADMESRISRLRQSMDQCHEWAQEARKLGDEESAKHYETDAAEIESLIIKGEALLAEGKLRSIKRVEEEISRLQKELADGEKAFRLEQIEDDIERLQFDLGFLEDEEMPQDQRQLKIDETKAKIAKLEEEKRELE